MTYNQFKKFLSLNEVINPIIELINEEELKQSTVSIEFQEVQDFIYLD